MKTTSNILIAFILNLVFAIFEFIGGAFTGSVAIVSDAFHDIGDCASIGLSYFFEKKSKRQPDEKYTYGYMRYSVLASLITSSILFFGSIAIIINAVEKIQNPSQINHNGMIILAIVGTVVNMCAAYITHNGDSLNQKAVNLHMLEDVLSWIIALVGAIVMRYTGFYYIDPIMSICVSAFILFKSGQNILKVTDVFLMKTPEAVSVCDVKKQVSDIKGICDIHHIHLMTLDSNTVYATMHIVTDEKPELIKEKVRHKLQNIGVMHATLELEKSDERCLDKNCKVVVDDNIHKHHHHHHH